MAVDERGKYKEVLVTEFTDASARKFREDFLSEARDSKNPIIVWIGSGGGHVDALAVMVETIESVPNKVITAYVGVAASCGATLLSFGDERYIGKYSRAMVHGMSSNHGRVSTLELFTDAEEDLRVENFWLGQLAQNCNVEGGLAALRQKIKDGDGKIWFDAEKAVAFGLADYIGTPEIKLQNSHSDGVEQCEK